jgi:hypothetical protein
MEIAPPLPIRSAPEPGESLKSVLLRNSSLNMYAHMAWITEAARLPRRFATCRCDFTLLAQLLQVNVRAIEKLAYWPVGENAHRVHFNDAQISNSCIDAVHSKVCPTCLYQSGTALQLWDLRTFIACPVHSRYLIDECSRCHRRLDWQRPSLATCQCGNSLTDTAGNPASPLAVVVSERLSAIYEGHGSQDPVAERIIPITDLDALVRLIWACGTLRPHPGNWRSAYLAKPRQGESTIVVERGSSVVTDWPNGLYRWLEAYRLSAEDDHHVGVEADFGALFRRIRPICEGPAFAPFWEEVRCYLANHWTGGFVKPWSFLYAAPTNPRVLGSRSAALRLGTTSADIRKGVDRGRVVGTSRNMGSRRLRLIDVAALMERALPDLTTNDMSAHLGISPGQVEKLRRAGLLTACSRSRYGYLYDANEPERLGRKLALYTSSSMARLRDAIAVADVPGTRQVQLADLIIGVFEGELSIESLSATSDTVPVLRRFRIDWEELIRFRRARGYQYRGGGCTVRAAARQLRVTVRMIPVLLRAGCLEALFSRRGAWITADSIARFPNRYLLSSAIAAKCGSSGRHVTNQLLCAGILPVVASDPGRGISAVWRLEYANGRHRRGPVGFGTTHET